MNAPSSKPEDLSNASPLLSEAALLRALDLNTRRGLILSRSGAIVPDFIVGRTKLYLRERLPMIRQAIAPLLAAH